MKNIGLWPVDDVYVANGNSREQDTRNWVVLGFDCGYRGTNRVSVPNFVHQNYGQDKANSNGCRPNDGRNDSYNLYTFLEAGDVHSEESEPV